jgi:hypothetical protein
MTSFRPVQSFPYASPLRRLWRVNPMNLRNVLIVAAVAVVWEPRQVVLASGRRLEVRD